MVSSMVFMGIISILLGMASQISGIRIVMIVTGVGMLASEFPAMYSIWKLKQIDIERISIEDRALIYKKLKNLSDRILSFTLLADALIIVGLFLFS